MLVVQAGSIWRSTDDIGQRVCRRHRAGRRKRSYRWELGASELKVALGHRRMIVLGNLEFVVMAVRDCQWQVLRHLSGIVVVCQNEMEAHCDECNRRGVPASQHAKDQHALQPSSPHGAMLAGSQRGVKLDSWSAIGLT